MLFYSTFGQNGTVRTKPFYPRLEDIKNILLLMIVYRPMYVCMISVDAHIYICILIYIYIFCMYMCDYAHMSNILVN